MVLWTVSVMFGSRLVFQNPYVCYCLCTDTDFDCPTSAVHWATCWYHSVVSPKLLLLPPPKFIPVLCESFFTVLLHLVLCLVGCSCVEFWFLPLPCLSWNLWLFHPWHIAVTLLHSSSSIHFLSASSQLAVSHPRHKLLSYFERYLCCLPICRLSSVSVNFGTCPEQRNVLYDAASHQTVGTTYVLIYVEKDASRHCV